MGSGGACQAAGFLSSGSPGAKGVAVRARLRRKTSKGEMTLPVPGGQREPGASSASVADGGGIPREQKQALGRPPWLGGPAHPGDTLAAVAGAGSSLLLPMAVVVVHRHCPSCSGTNI